MTLELKPTQSMSYKRNEFRFCCSWNTSRKLKALNTTQATFLSVVLNGCFQISFVTEYATVGYMAKRIQMRKNRFLAIQKIAEQKKLNVDGGPDDHVPKQTVSTRLIG